MNIVVLYSLVSILCSFELYANHQLAQQTVDRYANKSIPIYQYSSANANLGLSIGDPKANGEYLIINTFIKEGDVVIDAGANIGEWTEAAFKAEPQCLIYAFEPVPNIYKILEPLTQKFPQLKTFNSALGSKNAEHIINYHPNFGAGSTFFNRPVFNNIAGFQKIKVPVVRLDTFAQNHTISHIHFLKIDTEGAELEVVLGSENLLKNGLIDAIQFEYGGCYPDAKITLFEVYSLLSKYNYLIFRITPNGLMYIPEWNASLENFKYANYLALHV